MLKRADKKASERQVGGDHYKRMEPQPWDVVLAWERQGAIGHCEATAIEYLARWRRKGGMDDLRKAVHWIEKLIEVETKVEN